MNAPEAPPQAGAAAFKPPSIRAPAFQGRERIFLNPMAPLGRERPLLSPDAVVY